MEQKFNSSAMIALRFCALILAGSIPTAFVVNLLRPDAGFWFVFFALHALSYAMAMIRFLVGWMQSPGIAPVALIFTLFEAFVIAAAIFIRINLSFT